MGVKVQLIFEIQNICKKKFCRGFNRCDSERPLWS